MIVPSKVYRAYIFPVHWADSSNFRAICSRTRATSVCLRFRRILNCTRASEIFLEFINLLHSRDCHRVSRTLREIYFQRSRVYEAPLTRCCRVLRRAAWRKQVVSGKTEKRRLEDRRTVVECFPFPETSRSTCQEDVEDSARVGDSEGGASNHRTLGADDSVRIIHCRRFELVDRHRSVVYTRVPHGNDDQSPDWQLSVNAGNACT